jgi:hypothetical protein
MKKSIYSLIVFITCICSLYGQNKVSYLRSISYQNVEAKNDTLIFTLKNTSDSIISVPPINTYGNSLFYEAPNGEKVSVLFTNCNNEKYIIEPQKEKIWKFNIDSMVESINEDIGQKSPLRGSYKVIWEFNKERLKPFILNY